MASDANQHLCQSMRILILEDDAKKLQALRTHLSLAHTQVDIHWVGTFVEYLRELNQEKYDFLILDLVVPRHSKSAETVEISEIVEVTRGDYSCPNFRTPGIALTGYDEKAEDNFRLLNNNDFSVVTYVDGSSEWATALDRKIASLPSADRFDFVIVCALEKEAEGFAHSGFPLGESKLLAGLRCRTIKLVDRTGVIVTAPRMGLVTAAITASQAILAFQPQVICMSGICGGVPGAASIYDVVIAETCHQHDAGKWTEEKLKPEVYSVALDHQFAQKARTLISGKAFLSGLTQGISPNRNEFPEGVNSLSPSVLLAPASSGSAVLGDETVVAQLKEQQRKSTIFEMESYAIYEAARLSPLKPLYFSAKTVVDDGSADKSDRFHRVGCILSARVVVALLNDFDFL